MENIEMKNSTKHLIFLQVALVSLVLVGCSSVNTTEEPTVSVAVAGVIGAAEISGGDNLAKEPSSVLVGSSPAIHFRSNSVWMSHEVVSPFD
jgi:hypothetical protein